MVHDVSMGTGRNFRFDRTQSRRLRPRERYEQIGIVGVGSSESDWTVGGFNGIR